MKPMGKKYSQLLQTITSSILALSLGLGGVSCSAYKNENQFTKKLEAPSFVTRLFDSTQKTLSLSHPDGAHISWMGFVQSNDYKYFKVTRVKSGGKVLVQDGKENEDGEVFTSTSNSIFHDISVAPSEASSTDFTNGSITVAGSQDLQITVQYSPLIAVTDQETPHEAYLVINYDSPKVGFTRLRLKGVTKGVKADKCTQALSNMELVEYQIDNDQFDLYFCSGEVAKANQANTPTNSSDPGYHGLSTNITSIPLADSVIKFFKPDDETICVVSSDSTSIPDFVLPIPEGLAPITSMDISMVPGSFAECSLNSDGDIDCPENIQIDALVSLAGFSLRNTGFSAEELTSGDCPDFGAISGEGKFGDDEVTLILTGKTLSDQNTEEYNIVDSLIVAVLKMTKI